MFDTDKFLKALDTQVPEREPEPMILDATLFDAARASLELPEDATPGQVVRAHLAQQLADTGHNGIGISMDACGINQAYVTEIFSEYKFEIGPEYGPNWRTV